MRRRAVAAGTAVVALGAGLWACGGGSSDRSAEGGAAASPTPSRSYALSSEPRTIPAVREHTPARGPGWKPADGHRVVVSDAALADEGRLIASELGLT
ncbi:beta-N-acetylglucosaminidase, partial [Streptomyces sp. TRM76130]|nr:beta-N-acetylglucosaminidase [Streptomyces sp. TRM76130]